MGLIHQQAEIRKDNTSGMRGVSFVRSGKKRGKYRAYCEWEGVFHSLGYYDDPLDAGIAASEYRERVFPPIKPKPPCRNCTERLAMSKSGIPLCNRCYQQDKRDQAKLAH